MSLSGFPLVRVGSGDPGTPAPLPLQSQLRFGNPAPWGKWSFAHLDYVLKTCLLFFFFSWNTSPKIICVYKCFLFHLQSYFFILSIFKFLYFPPALSFLLWLKINPKVHVINCLNKNFKKNILLDILRNFFLMFLGQLM